MADTLSHVSLAGSVRFFEPYPTLTTMLVVVLAAVILSICERSTEPIQKFHCHFNGWWFGAALVLMNLSGGNSATSIQSYLFGSIVTITWEQVIFRNLIRCHRYIVLLFKRPMYVLTLMKIPPRGWATRSFDVDDVQCDYWWLLL